MASALLMMSLGGCDVGADRDGKTAGNETPANSDKQSSLPFVRRFEKVALPAPGLKSAAPVTAIQGTSAADRWNFPRIMAGGCGIADFNRDGRPDLVTVGLSPATVPELAVPCIQLLQQLESRDFVDVTSLSGLEFEGIPCGVASGDFTNDGLPDLCLTGKGDCRLFENLGDFRFRDLSHAAGVSRDRWSTSAAFLDYNRDGWLDLFVTNYVDYDPSHACRDAAGTLDFCSPAVFPRTTDRLYENLSGQRSAGGAESDYFRDVSVEAGISSQRGAGLGVAAADWNNDGWIDIFVANDGHPNFLWINQQNGSFQDEAVLRGVASDAAGRSLGSMGVAVADIDDNGLPDLFVTNLDGESNSVCVNAGQQFQELSAAWKMDTASWRFTGFGTALPDLNHDGRPDFIAVNGRVLRSGTAPEFWDRYRERQLLLLGGNGRFELPAGEDELSSLAAVGRGLAAGDVDRDGDLDLLIVSLDQPPLLLKNNMSEGNWLIVRPQLPTAGGREAIGATVRVTFEGGRRSGFLIGGGSYQSASEPLLHFGLGSVSRVQQVEVTWPDGSAEVFPGAEANQELVLLQGTGERQPSPSNGLR
jgi:hypothetical protein